MLVKCGAVFWILQSFGGILAENSVLAAKFEEKWKVVFEGDAEFLGKSGRKLCIVWQKCFLIFEQKDFLYRVF